MTEVQLLREAHEVIGTLLKPIVADENKDGYDARDVRNWERLLARIGAALSAPAQPASPTPPVQPVPDGIVTTSAAQDVLEQWFEELGLDLDVEDSKRLFDRLSAAITAAQAEGGSK